MVLKNEQQFSSDVKTAHPRIKVKLRGPRRIPSSGYWPLQLIITRATQKCRHSALLLLIRRHFVNASFAVLSKMREGPREQGEKGEQKEWEVGEEGMVDDEGGELSQGGWGRRRVGLC